MMRNSKPQAKGRVPRTQNQYTLFLADQEMGLLDFIMYKLRGISRGKAKAILSAGGVLVDEQVQTHYNFRVMPDMLVKISKSAPVFPIQNRGNMPQKSFEIVYEDEHLIVVDKDDEVLSVGVGRNSLNMKDLLDEYFLSTHQRCHAHVVHRLDARTSGLMLYAKSVEVQQAFVNNWRQMVTDRRYVAVVEGVMEKSCGHIESFLTESPSLKMHSSRIDNGGKFASTDWQYIRSNNLYSLIELKLHTGRKNQIRVHMSVLGHPIAGDYKYGARAEGIARLCLHAFCLAFTHPVTGEELAFSTPYPVYFTRLVE